MNFRVFLYLFLLNFFWLENQAQQVDISTAKYDLIRAEKFIETVRSLDLTGSIEKVSHIYIQQNDTSFFTFDEEGFLVNYQYEPPATIGQRPIIESFIFDANHQLKQLSISQSENDCDIDKYFNSEGFLIRETEVCSGTDEAYDHEAKYNYSNNHSKLTVDFNNKKRGYGSVVEKEEYEFSFNDLGLLILEKSKVYYTDSNYGNQHTFTYDTHLRLPISIGYRADCAGSNSCLDLHLTIAYDANGNKISEVLSDHTIRNDLWSHSYHVNYTYNMQQLLIEECWNKGISGYNLSPFSTEAQTGCAPAKYSYTFDSNGNWIKKYLKYDDSLLMIEERIIEYKK